MKALSSPNSTFPDFGCWSHEGALGQCEAGRENEATLSSCLDVSLSETMAIIRRPRCFLSNPRFLGSGNCSKPHVSNSHSLSFASQESQAAMEGMDIFLDHSFHHRDRVTGRQKKNTVQLH